MHHDLGSTGNIPPAPPPLENWRRIRDARHEDIPILEHLSLLALFQTQKLDALLPDPRVVRATVGWLISSESGTVLVVEDSTGISAMAWLQVFSDPISGDRVALCSSWWGDPDTPGSGDRLFKAIERWAVRRGAVGVQMTARSD